MGSRNTVIDPRDVQYPLEALRRGNRDLEGTALDHTNQRILRELVGGITVSTLEPLAGPVSLIDMLWAEANQFRVRLRRSQSVLYLVRFKPHRHGFVAVLLSSSFGHRSSKISLYPP